MAKSTPSSKTTTTQGANPFDPFDFFGQWRDLLSKAAAGSSANPLDPFGLLRSAPVDLGKALDPFQVARTIMSGMPSPSADVDAVLDGQRKNLEAVQKAQQVALSSMMALLQRQADILREMLEEATRSAQSAVKGTGTGDLAAEHSASVREAMDRGLGILRELSELVAKANSETFEVLNKRFSEGLAEIRGLTSQR